MKEVRVGRNYVAVVDDNDFALVSKYCWSAHRTTHNVYAITRINGTTKAMHRLILDAPEGKVVDHIDRNGLNNTRANLRHATWVQNLWNRNKAKGKSSRYLGVEWHTNRRRWIAKIRHNGKYEEIGTFTDEKEAARAWNKKAKEYRGEFARLNDV